MFFNLLALFFKTSRLFVAISAASIFFGCTTSPHVSHIGDVDSDGYYESLTPLGKKGYFLKQLAPNVYFFSTGTYNNLFVATQEGVVITDPIKGKGDLLKKAIGEITNQPIRFMIYSHSHIDHIGDAHLFASDNVQIVAQVETGKALKKYKDKNRPVPHINFGTNYSLSIGGITLELIYPGEGHDKGNSIIHIPSRKIVMYVDTVTPKSVPFKNFAYTKDIYNQMKSIEKVLKLDFDVYVAGHLHRPGLKKEMREVFSYYRASQKASVEALKRVSFIDVRAKSKTKDIERLFGEYLDTVAEECYRILKPKWKKRLMGFEAFTKGHCDIWISYHRTQQAP